MIKKMIKLVIPKFILKEYRKAKFHPKLDSMGIKPLSARLPVKYMGTEYGGHAINPLTISREDVIYTLGAGLDISFEEELISQTACHVHVYDPTPRSVAWLNKKFNSNDNPHALGANITIHPVGIWSSNKKMRFFAPKNPDDVSYSITNMQGTQNYIDVDCISMKNAMQENGHNQIDLLKLNVEGAEYEIINSMFDDEIYPRMILINYDEVHTQADDQAPHRLIQLSSRIRSMGYKVIFAEFARVTYTL